MDTKIMMDAYGGPDCPEARTHQERGVNYRNPETFRGLLFTAIIALGAVVSVTALTACSTSKQDTSSAVLSFKQVWCATNDPIRPTPEELASKSEQQKRSDLEHNIKGAQWCGWKP
jgi:hypothetical protein